MKKKLLSLMLILMIGTSMVLGGCATKKIGTADAPKSEEKGELRMSWWGSEERHKATLDAIKLFEDKNPNIKIASEYSGFDGYFDKLKVQLAGGSAPDLFQNASAGFSTQVPPGYLLELDGLIDTNGFDKAALNLQKFNGKTYGAYLTIISSGFLYNKTQLDKYGIKVPKYPYSWEDFSVKLKEVAEKSKGKLYGATDESTAFEVFKAFTFATSNATGKFFTDDAKLNFTEDQVKKYYQYWADLRAAKAVAPVEQSAISDDSANSLVVKGTAAFVCISTGSFARLQSQTKDELGIIPMPESKEGKGIGVEPGIVLSINSKTKLKNSAVKFMNFFTHDEEAAKVLKTTRGILPTEMQRKAFMNSGNITQPDKTVIEAMDVISKVKTPMPTVQEPKGATEIFGWKALLEKVGQEIAFGKISIDEGSKKFMKEAQKTLDNAK